MGLNIALTDSHPGDGGFCCIPGSRAHYDTLLSRRCGFHSECSQLVAVVFVRADKGELLPPLEVRRLDVDLGMVQQVSMKAGSVCVFTEALRQYV